MSEEQPDERELESSLPNDAVEDPESAAAGGGGVEEHTESFSGPEVAVVETLLDPSASDSVVERLGHVLGGLPRVSLHPHGEEDAGPLDPEDRRLLTSSRPFEVLGELGRGGMGIVLRAHDRDLGRDVAIKVLHERYARRPDVLRRFVEEAQIGGQLQHPGIVQVYEIGLQGGQEPFFVMRLFKGSTLAELLRARRDLKHDLSRFLGIFLQVCQAVGYAHERGVIHRDLKPSNIMVGAFGAVQVADWGLAKVLGRPDPDADPEGPGRRKTRIFTSMRDATGELSTAGTVMGTIAFMPPEQARGEIDKLDERSDVFALGAILCLILTGKPASVGEREEALRRAIEGDQTELRERLAACEADPALVEMTGQCLSVEQAARPANAGELATRIQDYLNSVEARAEAARIAAAEERVKAASERRARWLTLALATTVLVAVVGGSVAYSISASRRAERERVTTEAVRDALSDAERLRSAAESAGSSESGRSDVAPWDIALQAAQRARDLAAADVAQSLRQRAEQLHAELQTQRHAIVERAAQDARNRNLYRTLIDIREASIESNTAAKETLEAYERAVLDFGIDVRKTPPAQLIEIIGRTGMEREIVGILDQLAFTAREALGKFNLATTVMLSIASQVDPDSWRSKLRAAVSAEDSDEILTLADSVDPHSPPATLALLALTLEGMSYREEALEVFELACLEHPADLWLRVEAAISNLRQSRRTGEERYRMAAFAHANAAVALRPDLGATWALLARATSGDASMHALERATELRGGDTELFLSMAQELRREGELEQARILLEKARDRDPDSPVPWVRLAQVLRELRRPEDAIPLLQRAVELAPEDQTMHTGLGWALQQAGRNDEAMAAFDAAIALAPDDGRPHAGKSMVFRARGEVPRQIDELRLAIQLRPRALDFRHLLVDACRQSGKFEEAVEAAHEALELSRDHVGIRISLAAALSGLLRFDEAIAEAQKTVELAPQVYSTHFCLGVIQLRAGRYRDAAEELARSAELASELRTPPPEPIAEALRQARAATDAQDRLDAVLAGDAELAEADNPLVFAQMCQTRGRAADALRFYREAFRRDPAVAEDPFTHHRYNAACAAALVAGAPERQLALDWLAANLDALETLLAGERHDAVVGILEHTLVDPDFARVRDEEALAGLPAEERAQWAALWQRLDDLIESAR